jgi:hypothetical protein
LDLFENGSICQRTFHADNADTIILRQFDGYFGPHGMSSPLADRSKQHENDCSM